MINLDSIKEKSENYLKENSLIATVIFIIVAVMMFLNVSDKTLKDKIKIGK